MGRKETQKRYRANHLDKIKAYNKKYRAEHIDDISKKAHEYNTEYYQKHRQQEIERARKYTKDNAEKISRRYKDNKETICAKQKEYRSLHPEKSLEHIHARRARKKGNGGKFTSKEWKSLLERYNNTCLCCGRNDVKPTADHVIPLSQGGSNSIDNIQPLCMSCNSKKHAKHIDYRMQNSN